MTKQQIDALVDAYIARIDIFKHTSKSGQVRRWAILRIITGGYITSKPSCALSAKDDNQEAGEQLAITNAKNELANKLLLSEGYTFEEINSLRNEATKPPTACPTGNRPTVRHPTDKCPSRPQRASRGMQQAHPPFYDAAILVA